MTLKAYVDNFQESSEGQAPIFSDPQARKLPCCCVELPCCCAQLRGACDGDCEI
jgi:hypothetical protein